MNAKDRAIHAYVIEQVRERWSYPTFCIGHAVIEDHSKKKVSRSKRLGSLHNCANYTERLRNALGTCVMVFEQKATKSEVVEFLEGLK